MRIEIMELLSEEHAFYIKKKMNESTVLLSAMSRLNFEEMTDELANKLIERLQLHLRYDTNKVLTDGSLKQASHRMAKTISCIKWLKEWK